MTVQIIELLFQILLVLIGGLLIPILKHKIGEAKYVQILSVVDIAVAAAEQIYRTMPGGKAKNQARFEYVVNYLNSKGIKLSEEELKTLIEGAVLELNEVVRK